VKVGRLIIYDSGESVPDPEGVKTILWSRPSDHHRSGRAPGHEHGDALGDDGGWKSRVTREEYRLFCREAEAGPAEPGDPGCGSAGVRC